MNINTVNFANESISNTHNADQQTSDLTNQNPFLTFVMVVRKLPVLLVTPNSLSVVGALLACEPCF